MKLLPVFVTMTGMAFAAIPAFAQAPAASSLSIVAPRRDTIVIDSSSAATAVFRLHNASNDSVTVTPELVLPRGWEPLMRPATVHLSASGTDLWLAGVQAPRTTVAGTYVVCATVSSNGKTVSDSVIVRVDEVRAIELIALDAPGWILSGAAYEARFQVRNRGNVTTNVALSANSSRGVRATVSVPVVSLAPGERSVVNVRMNASTVRGKAQDDLLELVAEDQHDSRVRVAATSRTTMVPKSGGMSDNLATIPSTLSIRAAPTGSGVSPATIAGKGLLPGTKTMIDYAAYVPAKGQSVFNDRDEYRLSLERENLSAHVGDALYGYSDLTSAGSLGFGAEVDAAHAFLHTGAYVERSRWATNAPTEAGLTVGTPRELPMHFDLTAVGRTGDGMPTGLFSLAGGVPVPHVGTLSVETAASDNAGHPAVAERSHLVGALGKLNYDFLHQRANAAYAGPQRGAGENDASVSLAATRDLSFHGYGALHDGASHDQFGTGAVGATYGAWGSVDYAWTSRSDVTDSLPVNGAQRGLRATTTLPLGPASLSLDGSAGSATDGPMQISRNYLGWGGSLNLRLANGGALSFFGEHSDGRTLGADGRPTNSGGAVGMFALGALRLTVTSSVSSMRRSLSADSAAVWFGQGDARLEYRLPTETTIGLRAHYWMNPAAQGVRANNAMYLEVKRPLSLPVGRQRRLGRVEGRVTDASGAPLSGVLVHVGDQIGITDHKGEVSMFGLSSGTHGISLDGAGTTAQTMLTGDAVVTVNGASDRPASFAVSVARGAHLRGQISLLDFATTGAASGDSLIQTGTLSNVTVALLGTRDTLYQTSDDKGAINFGAITPGRWTLAVLPGAEVPDFHAFQNERVDLDLAPGTTRDIELRVVPRKRAVTLTTSGGTLKVKNQQDK